MGYKQGDLVKWVSYHNAFEASPSGLKGIQPVYRHGIVIEVSHKKKTAIIVHCFDCPSRTLVILDTKYDPVQLVSGGDDG